MPYIDLIMHAVHGHTPGCTMVAIKKHVASSTSGELNTTALKSALKKGVENGTLCRDGPRYRLSLEAHRWMSAHRKSAPKPPAAQGQAANSSEYEEQRASNISENQAFLKSLGLLTEKRAASSAKATAPLTRFKPPPLAERKSVRVASRKGMRSKGGKGKVHHAPDFEYE